MATETVLLEPYGARGGGGGESSKAILCITNSTKGHLYNYNLNNGSYRVKASLTLSLNHFITKETSLFVKRKNMKTRLLGLGNRRTNVQ